MPIIEHTTTTPIQLIADEFALDILYKIQNGDTLASIAQKNGVSVDQIRKANSAGHCTTLNGTREWVDIATLDANTPLSGNDGFYLIVPSKTGFPITEMKSNRSYVADSQVEKLAQTNARPVQDDNEGILVWPHLVQENGPRSLNDLAAEYGVSAENIRDWNNFASTTDLNSKTFLLVGSTLNIPVKLGAQTNYANKLSAFIKELYAVTNKQMPKAIVDNIDNPGRLLSMIALGGGASYFISKGGVASSVVKYIGMGLLAFDTGRCASILHQIGQKTDTNDARAYARQISNDGMGSAQMVLDLLAASAGAATYGGLATIGEAAPKQAQNYTNYGGEFIEASSSHYPEQPAPPVDKPIFIPPADPNLYPAIYGGTAASGGQVYRGNANDLDRTRVGSLDIGTLNTERQTLYTFIQKNRFDLHLGENRFVINDPYICNRYNIIAGTVYDAAQMWALVQRVESDVMKIILLIGNTAYTIQRIHDPESVGITPAMRALSGRPSGQLFSVTNPVRFTESEKEILLTNNKANHDIFVDGPRKFRKLEDVLLDFDDLEDGDFGTRLRVGEPTNPDRFNIDRTLLQKIDNYRFTMDKAYAVRMEDMRAYDTEGYYSTTVTDPAQIELSVKTALRHIFSIRTSGPNDVVIYGGQNPTVRMMCEIDDATQTMTILRIDKE